MRVRGIGSIWLSGTGKVLEPCSCTNFRQTELNSPELDMRVSVVAPWNPTITSHRSVLNCQWLPHPLPLLDTGKDGPTVSLCSGFSTSLVLSLTSSVHWNGARVNCPLLNPHHPAFKIPPSELSRRNSITTASFCE